MSNPAPARTRAAALAAAAATIYFLLPWWNRHLGLSLDGYMPWFGHRILAGEIPYRDFFLHLPPLHALAEAALESLFGKSIVAGRLAGAIVHVLMAATSAAWLARRFSVTAAVASSVAAVVVASSDDTEILDLYNPHAALAAVLSGYLACVALDRRRWAAAAAWGSGVAAGLAFWIKQTVGLGATLAVPLVLAVVALRAHDSRRDLAWLGKRFVGGWVIVGLVLGGWLASHGAFSAFVEQVFGSASQSKGPPLELLLRPWMAPFDMPSFERPAIVTLALIVVTLALVDWRRRRRASSPRAWPGAVLGGGAAAALVWAGMVLAESSPKRILGPAWKELLVEGHDLGVLLGFYGSAILVAVAVVTAIRRPLSEREREIALFAIVAASIALMQSVSFATNEAAAYPSLALVATLAIDGARRNIVGLAPAFLAAALTAVALLSATALHRLQPFRFAGWLEPAPWESVERSEEPALRGLRLSPITVETVDGVLDAIRRASEPHEPIFCFPVYPIFYWLAERPPVGFASIHWIDVVPDRIVLADRATLEREVPVVIVRQWIPKRILNGNEAYFRGGRPSGMRRMNEFLDELLISSYQRTYRAPRSRLPYPRLEVWVRKDRALERGLPIVK